MALDKFVSLVDVPDTESDYHSSRLSNVPSNSRISNDDTTQRPRGKTKSKISHGDESMTVVISAFYAKLLIVLGIALPITSTIQNEQYTNITSDILSIYLYTGSMIFLCQTFYQLRKAKKEKKDNHIKRTRYGSFYLHMGVAGFSVGSIIYSCLQFGGYFDLSGDCQQIVVALKPILRIIFMVAQSVFVFSYTDILEPMRGDVIDRFGLMHLLATNICEWLNVIIQETRDDILAVASDNSTLFVHASSDKTTTLSVNGTVTEIIYRDGVNWTCNVSDMITPLIKSVNPYLRPCGVEYSLLCSVIIAVIWNDICTVPGSSQSKTNGFIPQVNTRCCGRLKSSKHFSVDCGNAHKGLFMGIAVLAGTIVSLMLFNGLFYNKKHVELALFQINIWEIILFLLMSLGSAACIQRMRQLTVRRVSSAMPLEHALLLVTQSGVYLYYLFQIIGASFIFHDISELSTFTRVLSPLSALIQSSCQTLLVLDAWSRRCDGTARRPGRQLITFLLVGNLALWLLNRVKNSRAEFHPIQMEFYGVWAWTLITHVSVPLLVCYRFQATVCFYEIWKNSYKYDKNNDFELESMKINDPDEN